MTRIFHTNNFGYIDIFLIVFRVSSSKDPFVKILSNKLNNCTYMHMFKWQMNPFLIWKSDIILSNSNKGRIASCEPFYIKYNDKHIIIKNNNNQFNKSSSIKTIYFIQKKCKWSLNRNCSCIFIMNFEIFPHFIHL